MLPSIRLSLLLAPLLALTASLSPQTIQLSVRDGEADAPYLDIHYDPSSLTASILKTHTPPLPNNANTLVALGFHRPSSSSSKYATAKDDDASWTSIRLPPSALQPGRNRTLTLLVDRAGHPHHLGLTSQPTDKDKNDGVLAVRARQMQAGPAPVLNRPVVLGRDGKVEGAEQEKGFLQKYWWAIAIFLVIQVALGGGGGEGK